MRHKSITLDFADHEDSRMVVFTGCWHVGNPSCRVSAIEELMRKVSACNIPWFHLGDIIEAISPLDKRFHCETHDATIMKQLSCAAKLASIGRKTLVGACIGNHEDSLSRHVGDVTKEFLGKVSGEAEDNPGREVWANDKWLSGAAFVNINCPGGTCETLVGHSRISVGGGTSDPDRDQLNRQIKLRRRLGGWKADLKVVAHGHHGVVAPPVTAKRLISRPPVDERGEIQRQEKMERYSVKPEWCAMVPSMFATYDSDQTYPSYGEISLYPPNDIGWVEAEIARDGQVLEVKVVEI